MKTKLILLFLLPVELLAADDISAIKMPDGKIYQHVRVVSVTAEEMRIVHDGGAATIPLQGVRLPASAAPVAAEQPASQGARVADSVSSAEEAAARQVAERTGQAYEICLQAVKVWSWCQQHPQGGTVNGVVYDQEGRRQQMTAALRVLAPQAAPPQAAALGGGGAGFIESSIDGEFTGFEGERVFKLLNGQVWQQTDFHFHYHYAYGPRVQIYNSERGMVMKVDGVEKAVRVMQLK